MQFRLKVLQRQSYAIFNNYIENGKNVMIPYLKNDFKTKTLYKK